ncbi:MAG: PocR ligand-binding domain-containing protein [Candidatus Delongbacteria bacterium]|nr:PocR ligand-binding domain-containing protein [Candidatus Delongbacteria bacterium]
MKANIFPINPIFITKLKEAEFAIKEEAEELIIKGEEDDLNNIGVIGEDMVQGFLAVVSHEDFVQSPVTLYEFIPDDLLDLYNERKRGSIILEVNDPFIKSIIKNKIVIRTDNEKHFKLKRCCTFFRECMQKGDLEGTYDCFKLDGRVGFISIAGLTIDNFEEKLTPIIEEYNKQSNTPEVIIVPKLPKIRPFLIYNCPFSGLWEIIFPIYHEKRVIGCIMMGEVISKEISEEIIFKKFLTQLQNRNIQLTKSQSNELKSTIGLDIRDEEIKFGNLKKKYINSTLTHLSY